MSPSHPSRTPLAHRPRRAAVATVAVLVGVLGLAGCRSIDAGDDCTGYRDPEYGAVNRSFEAMFAAIQAHGLDLHDPSQQDAVAAYEASDEFKADSKAQFDALASKYLWQEGDTTASDGSGVDNLVCRSGRWEYMWTAAQEDLTTSTGVASPTSTTASTTTSSSTTTSLPLPTTTTTIPVTPAISLTLPGGTTTSTDHTWSGVFDGTGIEDDCAWTMTNDPGLVGFGDGIIAFVCQGTGDATATLRLYVFASPPGSVPTDFNGSDTGYKLETLDATVSQGGSSESFAGSLDDAWFDWSWQLPFDVADGDITVDINSLSYAPTPTQAF
jgi:hypothetical protein